MAMSKKQVCPSSVEWPDKAVSILLKTYALKFSVDRGYLRTQDWQEVAYAVNSVCDHVKTLKQCRDKVDSLKRRYKMEKRKAVTGSEVSWPFFHRLDGIMNSVLKQGKGFHLKHPNASSALASADAEDEDDGDNADEVEEFQEEEEEENYGKLHEAVDEDREEEAAEGDAHDDDEKLDASAANLSASSDRPLCLQNGKAPGHAENHYDMSDGEVAINGHSYRHLHPRYGEDRCRRLQHTRHGLHFPHAHRHSERAYHDHPFLQHATSRLYTLSGGTHESTQNSSQGKANRARSRSRKRKFECNNGIDALANAVTGLSKPGSAVCFSDVFARIELSKMKMLKKVKLEVAKLDRRQSRTCTPSKPHLAMSTSS